MTTYNFVLNFKLNVNDMFPNSSLNNVYSISYMASDIVKKTYQFYAVYLCTRTASNTSSFVFKYYIKNQFTTFNFMFPYIANKDQVGITKTFNNRFLITTILDMDHVFSLKNRFQLNDTSKTYAFVSQYKMVQVTRMVYEFILRNNIDKKVAQDKMFYMPYSLSSGDNKYPTVVENGRLNGIADIYYYVDGVTGNLGDIATILFNQIFDPIIMYVVVSNGAYSMFKIGKFIIDEDKKYTQQTDNGIGFYLDDTRIRLQLNVDPTVPVSVKFIRRS